MLVTCHGWFPLTGFEAIEPGDFRRVLADRAVDQVADPRGRDRVPDQDLQAKFRWFTGARPSYRADFARTRELAPGVRDLHTCAAERSSTDDAYIAVAPPSDG